MLFTPFGQIKIYADNFALVYEATERTYDRPPVKDHPIAAHGLRQTQLWSDKESL